MPALHDLQQGIGGAVTGNGDGAAVLPCIVDDGPGAAARLAVYANHYRVTLIDALAATFPVTARLVGCDFFRAAARRHVRETPPRQPVLCEYGADFPDFLAELQETATVPFLADVARLEWAINAAWHAPDPRPAYSSDPAALRLHPSCRLVVSPFAVDDVWQAHQEDEGDLAAIDVHRGPVRLLVGRNPDDTVGWIRLPEAETAFAAGLIEGADLADALTRARAADPAFDAVPFVAALIDSGFVILPDPDQGQEILR